MNRIKSCFIFIAAPLLTTGFVMLIGLIEPALRSTLKISQATEGSPIPSWLGGAFFLIAFFLCHLLFLGASHFVDRLRRRKTNKTLFSIAYSTVLSLFAAVALHRPEVDEWYKTFSVAVFFIAFPFCIAELLVQKTLVSRAAR